DHLAAGGQVPYREHRVRPAAAEVGLQVDHRRSVLVAADTPNGAEDQVSQAVCEVGALEERARISVLRVALPAGDHREVGGELGGVEVPAGDVLVRGEDLPPRFDAL